MGKHFGNLQKLKGVTYYSLSPDLLNPFKGIIFPGVYSTIRRLILRNIVPMGIPLGAAYLFYYYVHEEYKKFQRKDHEAYKNDV